MLLQIECNLMGHVCFTRSAGSIWQGFCLIDSFNQLQEHSGRVFRLQFDEFQIISSSHDDTILIWDFLNVPSNATNETRSPSRTYTYISR